ncbi:hypothetical protein Tco_0286447 [Tanacetum coccineum]
MHYLHICKDTLRNRDVGHACFQYTLSMTVTEIISSSRVLTTYTLARGSPRDSLIQSEAELLGRRVTPIWLASTDRTGVELLGSIDLRCTLVEEGIVEPAGEGSPDLLVTRDGIDRIVGIETAQERLEADQLSSYWNRIGWHDRQSIA